jgi:hypothetical protein
VLSATWGDGKFAGFHPDELADMATRCELRWQLPRTLDDRYLTAVRSLYTELTGDPAEAAHATPRAMSDALRVDADDDATDVHRRLAVRRAGQRVDSSGSVYERYLQLQLDESERAHRDGVPAGPKFTMTGCDRETSMFRSTR